MKKYLVTGDWHQSNSRHTVLSRDLTDQILFFLIQCHHFKSLSIIIAILKFI